MTPRDKIHRFRSHEDVAMRLARDPKQPEWIRKAQQGIADRMLERVIEAQQALRNMGIDP